MDIKVSQIGDLISEGKTKKVFYLKNDATFDTNSQLVYITNKDNISAGDNSRNRRIMDGKGRITVETSSAIFNFLNAVGIQTAFVGRDQNTDNSFVAKHCQMIPIELVIRRVATGTYLALNPDISEGTRFATPVVEIHIKDDANHDPLWSIETLVKQKFVINGLLVDEEVVEKILKLSKLVYEILERVWHSIDYQLIDLKVEFGVIQDENDNKSLVLADIIDNETWRLWPFGDKKLMVDKQIYRVYKEGEVDDDIVDHVRSVFQEVSDLTQKLFGLQKTRLDFIKKDTIVVLTGSPDTSQTLAQNFVKQLQTNYNITDVEIIAVDESTKDLNKLIDKISQSYCEVIVTIGVQQTLAIASKIAVPVIAYNEDKHIYNHNHNKSVNDRSSTAQVVAKVLAINNLFIWATIKREMFYKSLI